MNIENGTKLEIGKKKNLLIGQAYKEILSNRPPLSSASVINAKRNSQGLKIVEPARRSLKR